MQPPSEREFNRATAKMAVELVCEGAEPIEGSTQDLSMNGLFVICSERVPMGTHCRFSVELAGLDGPSRVEGTGRISRVEPDGMGVQITEIGMESYEQLRKLVLYHCEESSSDDGPEAA